MDGGSEERGELHCGHPGSEKAESRLAHNGWSSTGALAAELVETERDESADQTSVEDRVAELTLTGPDTATSNGDLFSPDLSDKQVTVICKSDQQKGEHEACDGYDTHSDSIETLEEESPLDDPQGHSHLTCDLRESAGPLLLQNEGSGLIPESVADQGMTEDGVFSADRGMTEDGVFSADRGMTEDGVFSADQGMTEDGVFSADRSMAEDSVFSADQAAAATSAAPCVLRPESLSLPRPLQQTERRRSPSEPQAIGGGGRGWGQTGVGHQRTRSEATEGLGVGVRGDLGQGDDVMSRSLPHGVLTRKGEMVEFVADDLTEKIKRSSPMSRADSGSLGSRRSSQRSIASTSSATSTSVATSTSMSRSPSSLLTQSPDAAPPIDPGAVMELELAARHVADKVDLMMGNLRNNLHKNNRVLYRAAVATRGWVSTRRRIRTVCDSRSKSSLERQETGETDVNNKMSAITVGCSEAYKTSVDITCDSVDSSIKSMYALMAKCEELSTSMGPVYQIGLQIKEIKRLLERFEAQLQEKP